MSTFSHTDWTVICDSSNGDEPCMAYGRTDTVGGSTAADVRKVLKRRGWTIGAPDPDRERHRLDFCPDHKQGARP